MEKGEEKQSAAGAEPARALPPLHLARTLSSRSNTPGEGSDLSGRESLIPLECVSGDWREITDCRRPSPREGRTAGR